MSDEYGLYQIEETDVNGYLISITSRPPLLT